MTNQELIARLRSNIFGTGTTMLAADRIELLTAESQKDGEEILYLRERAEQLAKAVEALRKISKGPMLGMDIIAWVNSVMKQTRTALAELEGK